MSLLDSFFRRNEQEDHSAEMARERLKIIVAHERSTRSGPDYLPDMQKDILAVVNKYVDVSPTDIHIQLDSEGDTSVLEVNVTLPE